MREGSMRRSMQMALVLAAAAMVADAGGALAQRTGYSKTELARRREAIMQEAGGGLIVLFGADRREGTAHFRQDNDFYYFTGREDINAMLVMAPRTKETFLFLPEQNPREIMIEGANLLKDPNGAESAGVTAVHPLGYFDELLARRGAGAGQQLWVRLSPPDAVD